MAQQGISSSGGGYSQAQSIGGASSVGPAGSKAPPGGTGGRRFVRTQAGANQYKKPIGAEIIATPRDQQGIRAQGDKQSTDQYKALVSQDSGKQAAAMKALNNDQLQRLSEVAFSFSSSDPNVARLRAGVSIEMQRRGINVNQHGGLGGRAKQPKAQGSTAGGGGVEVINYTTGERYRVATKSDNKAAGRAQTASNTAERAALHQAMVTERMRQATENKATRAKAAEDKKAASAAAAIDRKTAQAQAVKNRQATALATLRTRNATKYGALSKQKPQVIKLAAPLTTAVRQDAADTGKALPGGRFPIRNIADLRNAIQAFGRAKPADRAMVAKFICKRAKALNAEHLLGPAVQAAAGYSPSPGSTNLSAVELAKHGPHRFRHGWIPIDGSGPAPYISNPGSGGSGKGVPSKRVTGQVTSVQTTHKGGPAIPGTGRVHGVKVETISRDPHFGKGTASKFERQPGESPAAYKRRMAAATTPQKPIVTAGSKTGLVAHSSDTSYKTKPEHLPQTVQEWMDYASLHGSDTGPSDAYTAKRRAGGTHEDAMAAGRKVAAAKAGK